MSLRRRKDNSQSQSECASLHCSDTNALMRHTLHNSKYGSPSPQRVKTRKQRSCIEQPGSQSERSCESRRSKRKACNTGIILAQTIIHDCQSWSTLTMLWLKSFEYRPCDPWLTRQIHCVIRRIKHYTIFRRTHIRKYRKM